MSTLSAIIRAAQTVYLWVLILGCVAFLFPNMGLGAKLLEDYNENDAAIKLALGWIFVGLLIEHARGAVLAKRQAHLAKAFLRHRGATSEDAIKILIGALNSDDDRVVQQAHKELRRLTAKDFGTSPGPWKEWLAQQNAAPVRGAAETEHSD